MPNGLSVTMFQDRSVIQTHTASYVRNLKLERIILAAAWVNDWFSLSITAYELKKLQQIPRCARTQHKNRIRRMGSQLGFVGCCQIKLA